ncbi:DUF3489 domain-containing protein [Roseobacter sp.]|uniref:DUF3489 domain-containing protein n=1 Tax=Roseobacter sp. TaxID=1907202 RepID=UPI0025E879FD|nr:DUF3489 domain-containing protein [Roseobacter sp.]
MTRSAKPQKSPRSSKSRRAAPDGTTKLQIILNLLSRDSGAALDDLCKATGWQSHSVRGAMAGTLKRKGHIITSQKNDGVRMYHLTGSN